MILIKQDKSCIPQELLDEAEKAQKELEDLCPEDRKDFIKKHSDIWRKFSPYLAKMSHDKCWYSEAKCAAAHFDVDHFRPKFKAKRTIDLVDADGYEWLAFDWKNFRLSAQHCNRLNKNESGDTVGKGNWFPLLEDSPKANWDNRCIEDEKVTLIDPTIKADLSFIDFDDRGEFIPSQLCVGDARFRIEQSAIIYGLNFEKLREARFNAMLHVKQLYEDILEFAQDLSQLGDKAPMASIINKIKEIQKCTNAKAEFSRAVRTQLIKLNADDILIDRSDDVT